MSMLISMGFAVEWFVKLCEGECGAHNVLFGRTPTCTLEIFGIFVFGRIGYDSYQMFQAYDSEETQLGVLKRRHEEFVVKVHSTMAKAFKVIGQKDKLISEMMRDSIDDYWTRANAFVARTRAKGCGIAADNLKKALEDMFGYPAQIVDAFTEIHQEDMPWLRTPDAPTNTVQNQNQLRVPDPEKFTSGVSEPIEGCISLFHEKIKDTLDALSKTSEVSIIVPTESIQDTQQPFVVQQVAASSFRSLQREANEEKKWWCVEKFLKGRLVHNRQVDEHTLEVLIPQPDKFLREMKDRHGVTDSVEQGWELQQMFLLYRNPADSAIKFKRVWPPPENPCDFLKTFKESFDPRELRLIGKRDNDDNVVIDVKWQDIGGPCFVQRTGLRWRVDRRLADQPAGWELAKIQVTDGPEVWPPHLADPRILPKGNNLLLKGSQALRKRHAFNGLPTFESKCDAGFNCCDCKPRVFASIIHRIVACFFNPETTCCKVTAIERKVACFCCKVTVATELHERVLTSLIICIAYAVYYLAACILLVNKGCPHNYYPLDCMTLFFRKFIGFVTLCFYFPAAWHCARKIIELDEVYQILRDIRSAEAATFDAHELARQAEEMQVLIEVVDKRTRNLMRVVDWWRELIDQEDGYRPMDEQTRTQIVTALANGVNFIVKDKMPEPKDCFDPKGRQDLAEVSAHLHDLCEHLKDEFKSQNGEQLTLGQRNNMDWLVVEDYRTTLNCIVDQAAIRAMQTDTTPDGDQPVIC